MPKRLPGRRVKHRMKRNWMKLSNKEGAVLRVETVINDPEFPLAVDPAKHSAQVTRLLRRLHVHQLIAKIPRSRRWRVSPAGRGVLAAAIKLREVASPGLYAAAA